MLTFQILANGLVLGGLYACIASGFSLVWGVLNIINILHGSIIVLGGYLAFFAYAKFGVHPFFSMLIAAPLFYAAGYILQRTVINRMIAAPVLLTLSLTFGLDLMAQNGMLLAFTADFRTLILEPPLGVLALGPVIIPVDRLIAMLLALALTGLLYLLLSRSRIGRAVVAVRMDREAAALMGVSVKRIYAVTFALGAMMAGASGTLLAMIYPISPLAGTVYLGKAFVICVLGGLGSVPGAMVGGIVLGIVESFGALWFGSENAATMSFLLLIVVLLVKPTGLLGRKGYQ